MPARERRIAPRIRQGAADRVVDVRVKPGIDVVLVDVSARGLLLETTRRLLPGAVVELHVSERDGRTAALRGRVVRCSVAALLPGEIRYRGAVQFERDQSWLTGANPIRERDTRQTPDDTVCPHHSTADSRG